MPIRQIVITEKTEGGYDWKEEGVTKDAKNGQPVAYQRDGVAESDENMYAFMATWLGQETKKAK